MNIKLAIPTSLFTFLFVCFFSYSCEKENTKQSEKFDCYNYGHQEKINPIHPLRRPLLLIESDKSSLTEELEKLLGFAQEAKEYVTSVNNLNGIMASSPLQAEILLELVSEEEQKYLVNELAYGTCSYCACTSEYTETLTYLLSKITDVNRIKYRANGNTILWEAADNGYLDRVKLLVAHGAHLNSICKRFDMQETAVTAAMRNGHSDVAKFLRAQGGLTIEELTYATPHH